MDKTEKLNIINEKLDKCICLFVECYQTVLTQRELLNKTLDDGYLNMSKARSIIGCSSLSILQIPSELEAKVTVDIKTDTSLVKTDDPSVKFEYPETNFDLIIDNNHEKKENSSISMPNWFGVLTPLSLKTSQKSFCRSLNLITSLCESQEKLKNLEQIYKALLMKAIIQRVVKASVTVSDELISSIQHGFCVLVGIGRDDTDKDIDYIVRKLLTIRLFENPEAENSKWNKNVVERDYEILCVSQFTLQSTLKGTKPDFHLAMGGEQSKEFYEKFLEQMKKSYKPEKIKDGKFGAMMQVNIQNDGPVTIILDSKKDQNKNKEQE
ncbi:unnamed protein product [Brachionus calyciflorus]|uniref:D-aminoacyl-tRNA deacylase n=1 Tax=Brachionus calyciflorus TaxID=104777 RepID=A0A813PKM5_9BILA|nr:unnamed protein product [Brachionus calyciflorus]